MLSARISTPSSDLRIGETRPIQSDGDSQEEAKKEAKKRSEKKKRKHQKRQKMIRILKHKLGRKDHIGPKSYKELNKRE